MTVEVIAEIGSNWNGDMGVLNQLAEVAARAGAATVKVQHYPDQLGPCPFTPAQLATAKGLIRAWDVGFLASVFDQRTLDDYRTVCKPARVKIASPELTKDDLLAELGGLEVLLSTGASNLRQVRHATSLLNRVDATSVTLLHCVSAYPAPPDHMNLRAMVTLTGLATSVGLSDHTMHPYAAPVAAVALGATVIEKHLTLSRDGDGPDHPYALEPDEFTNMVDAIRLTESMLGDGLKRVMPSEDPHDRRA